MNFFKKLIIIAGLILLLAPGLVSAAEQYYFDCRPKGACNDNFTSFTVMDTACAKDCDKGSGACPSAPDLDSTLKGTTQVKTNTQEPGVVTLENPLKSGATDVPTIVGTVIKGALGVMGALVLFMVVWGGFGWIFAVGNAEKIKGATQTIMWAIIGAFVVFVSYLYLGGLIKFFSGA